MQNYYFIILTAFVVAGVATTLWGLKIIITARKSLSWPSTEGRIKTSQEQSAADPLLPEIVYSYVVEATNYDAKIEFPRDLTPTEEFSKRYVESYPVGKQVSVYYQAENPAQSTLEPGLGNGDSMVFIIGLVMTIFGIIFIAI